MLKIEEKDSKVLREIAKTVKVGEIRSEKIQNVILQMRDALAAESDGVAIAAPQIGVSLRIFVVSGKVYDLVRGEEPKKDGPKNQDMIFINPEILKASKKKMTMEEGCLSIRDIYGTTKRSAKVKVRAYDEKGKQFEQGSSGLLAQIFQHETDHLNGILFTDHATNLGHYDHTQYEQSNKTKK